VSAGRILVELACPPGGQHRHRHGLGAQPLQDEPVRTGAHRGEPQSALVGALPLATLPPAPFAGLFTDRFGTPSAAIVGFATFPLGFLAFAMMTGNIVHFFAIWLLQHFSSILTTLLVFCRVVAERCDQARGIARMRAVQPRMLGIRTILELCK